MCDSISSWQKKFDFFFQQIFNLDDLEPHTICVPAHEL